MRELETYYPWDESALKLIANLKTCQQSKVHHREGNVYVHTQMVADEVERLGGYYATNANMQMTALLHDIAKPMTTQLEDGDWVSPGHAKLGEAIAREVLWTWPFESREVIAALIRYHGLPIWLMDKRDPSMALIEASLRCNMEELATFAECDFRGRICDDLEECLFKIMMFREKAEELGCLNSAYKFANEWSRLHYFKKGGYPGAEIWEPEGGWLTVMCGLPGSGKNSWVHKNWDGHIVELDAIRKQMKISPKDKKGQGKIGQAAQEKLRESFRKKDDVLLNATNITKQRRASVIDLAMQYRYKIKIVYIDSSLADVLSRNKSRPEKEQVPERNLRKMFRSLELPTLTECHVLEIVNESK